MKPKGHPMTVTDLQRLLIEIKGDIQPNDRASDEILDIKPGIRVNIHCDSWTQSEYAVTKSTDDPMVIEATSEVWPLMASVDVHKDSNCMALAVSIREQLLDKEKKDK